MALGDKLPVVMESAYQKEMARKADKTGTIYYIGGTLATPDTTGFPTLAAYLHDMYRKGYRGVCGPVGNFEDLDVKQWGYGVLATPGESGSVWDVEIFRSLSPTRQYRQLNADSGGWIMDDWEGYATKTDLLNKANETEVTAALSGKMQHGSVSLSNYTTVLEVATSVAVDTSVFVSQDQPLSKAEDSPLIGAEIQYLVLMDYGPRRTVIATQYLPGDGIIRTWKRQLFDGRWLQPSWTQDATATPPEEHDLPLEAGCTAFMRSKYFKSQENIVTFYATVQRESGFSDALRIATLPAGFRPLERTDFPATFSHFEDANARIPGFVMLSPDGGLRVAANLAGHSVAYVFGSFVTSA